MSVEEYVELLSINLRLMQPAYKVGDAFVEMLKRIEEMRLKEIMCGLNGNEIIKKSQREANSLMYKLKK